MECSRQANLGPGHEQAALRTDAGPLNHFQAEPPNSHPHSPPLPRQTHILTLTLTLTPTSTLTLALTPPAGSAGAPAAGPVPQAPRCWCWPGRARSLHSCRACSEGVFGINSRLAAGAAVRGCLKSKVAAGASLLALARACCTQLVGGMHREGLGRWSRSRPHSKARAPPASAAPSTAWGPQANTLPRNAQTAQPPTVNSCCKASGMKVLQGPDSLILSSPCARLGPTTRGLHCSRTCGGCLQYSVEALRVARLQRGQARMDGRMEAQGGGGGGEGGGRGAWRAVPGTGLLACVWGVGVGCVCVSGGVYWCVSELHACTARAG